MRYWFVGGRRWTTCVEGLLLHSREHKLGGPNWISPVTVGFDAGGSSMTAMQSPLRRSRLRIPTLVVLGGGLLAALFGAPFPAVSLLSPEPAAEQVDASQIILANGLSLADWVLLANDRLESGESREVLSEAVQHLGEFGNVPQLVALSDRAARALIQDLPLSNEAEARIALDRIDQLDRVPALKLHLARAHALLGDDRSAQTAYREWLSLVPQDHPSRLEVLRAYMGIQKSLVAREAERFADVVGRPFGLDATDFTTGWTDLHYAALLDLPGVAERLVDSGLDADVALLNAASLSPALGDDLNLRLIDAGHKSDADLIGWNPLGGETPLILAARRGSPRVAQMLLDRGANLHLADSDGRTALHLAARSDTPEIAELLLEGGADVNATDVTGATPLFLAVEAGSPDVVELLVRHGANANASKQEGMTPIQLAAQTAHTDVVRVLLRNGADHAAVDKNGVGALHLAAESGSLQLVEVLLDQGAIPDTATREGRSALHFAASGGNADAVELLLSRGADLSGRSSTGETALHYAARGGHPDVVRLLLERGLTARARTKGAQSVLHYAAAGGQYRRGSACAGGGSGCSCSRR